VRRKRPRVRGRIARPRFVKPDLRIDSATTNLKGMAIGWTSKVEASVGRVRERKHQDAAWQKASRKKGTYRWMKC
jgi:hypothetical protein